MWVKATFEIDRLVFVCVYGLGSKFSDDDTEIFVDCLSNPIGSFEEQYNVVESEDLNAIIGDEL